MEKIINYQILEYVDIKQLERAVKRWIELGYQPLGGMIAYQTPRYNFGYFCQTMVRYQK